ncbi:hypothetical protein AJ80_08818 [Polytolypa hystricis UAMH7299]|uniref:Uncharacterized protein n=1 Tax=Polytolypa hystricis (strain UAMH7299) TaxID=1447883 RepID=A0A2B7X0M2_POLH7|nr:hypothetical protein AJ80_08818 [Polytolypa hystricis UAMH7299]
MEEDNEYIVIPLSQVTIFRVSTQYNEKEGGSKTCSIVGMELHEAQSHAVIGERKESQSQSLEALEAPIALDDKPADSFVAIPSSLQTAVKKTPGGYEVNAEMTLDDIEMRAFWDKVRRGKIIKPRKLVSRSCVKKP